MQIQIMDLATDPADIEQDAQSFFDDHGVEPLVEAILVMGQLDPLEIDLGTGLPRWTPAQIAVINQAKGKVEDWRE